LAVVLLMLNATFVAAEFSLVKLRFTRFGTGAMKEAKKSQGVSKLLDDISYSSKLIRLGIVMCTVATGFILVPLVHELCASLGWVGSLQVRLAMLLSFLLAVSAHFILGELVPRALGLQYPVQALRGAVPVVAFARVLSKPFLVALNSLARGLLKLFKLDPRTDLDVLEVEAQIRSIVSEGEELPEFAENIVSNTLDLRKRVAYDIMIPRNQLIYFDTEDSVEENLKRARASGHTRFPICEADLDHCIGVIHIKDVFRSGKSAEEMDLREFKRPIQRFAMDEPLEKVMQRFLKNKQHFALLEDEFGGTVGAVTLEDVVEEIIGEIQDEFDRDREMVTQLDDGRYLVDGLTPLHDLSEAIGMAVEADEVSTFGGYITLALGRMPRRNESFRAKNLEITVTNLDERRVVAATVKIVEEKPVGEDEDDEKVS